MLFESIERKVLDNVPIGAWLVTFDAIYGTRCNEGEHEDCFKHGCDDNEPSYIAEVDSSVIQISFENYIKGEDYEAITKREPLWEGDTHDLRSRIFETEVKAKEHEAYTLKRFKHPSPWEVFVRTA